MMSMVHESGSSLLIEMHGIFEIGSSVMSAVLGGERLDELGDWSSRSDEDRRMRVVEAGKLLVRDPLLPGDPSAELSDPGDGELEIMLSDDTCSSSKIPSRIESKVI